MAAAPDGPEPDTRGLTWGSNLARAIAALLAATIAALATALAVRSVRLTALAVTPLPWWDQWDVVLDLARWQSGQYRPTDLFSLHNEHRIFLPRLFFLIDIFAFRGSNTFLCAASFVLQALHLAVLAALVRAARLGSIVAAGLVAFAAACLFAPAQLENFAWGFQVQFVGVYLAATASFFYLSHCVDARRRSLAATIACAVAANYTMANGILTWPLLLVLCVWLRLPPRAFVAIALAGLVFGGAFVHGHGTNAGAFAILAHPARVAEYVALFVGGPFQSFGESTARTLGGIGIASSALATLRFLRSDRRREATGCAIAAVGLFVWGTILLTAVGRQDFPVTQAMSSRYATPALLLWWTQAAVWALPHDATARGARSAWRGAAARDVVSARPLAVLAAGCALTIALFMEGGHDRDVARFYFETRTRAAVALVTGVDDLTDIRPTQPEGYRVFALRPVLERLRISVYATAPPPLGEALARSYVLAEPARCLGALDASESLPPPPADDAIEPPSPPRPTWLHEGVRVTGWAFDAGAGAAAREVLLVDEDGVLVGLGRSIASRDDVSRALPQVPSDAPVGWFGLAWKRAKPGLRAYAVLRDGSACPLAGAPGAPQP